MVNRKKPERPERKPIHSQEPKGAPRERDEAPVLAEDAADDAVDLEPVQAPQLIRLNKYLADHGVASRRRCDELIQAGQVSVDGEHVTELGLKVDPDRQVIEVDGVILKSKDARKRYYVLNKPAGVVCTNEPRETRPRAVDLITDPYKGRIYTVGRLDEESKGLILVTNDGDFANKIMHPRYGIEKTYTVRVAGRIDDDSLTKIREGVHLSEGRTSGARILVDRRTADVSQLTVTISEGMNREIRRVFARVGYKVTDLRRVRIGPLTDRGLKPGRWRELLNREVDELLAGKNQVQEESRIFEPSGPRKRFPKKQGYSRDFVKGGKLVPGARREREAKPKIRPVKSFGGPSKSLDDEGTGNSFGGGSPRKSFGGASARKSFGGASSAPRAGGARFGGPRTGGPRSSGPRTGPSSFGGPRSSGPRAGGSRPGGSRPGPSRFPAPRADGARPGARRTGGPNASGTRGPARFGGGRPGGARTGAPHGPRSGGPGAGGLRSSGPRSSGPGSSGPRSFGPRAGGPSAGGPRGGRGPGQRPAPRGGRNQRGEPR